MSHPLEVMLSRELAHRLDHWFSPADGVEAIDQIKLELPLLHPYPGKKLGKKLLRRLTVFHGKYDWYPLGFSYVQVGHELHILDLWSCEENRLWSNPKFTVVLGTDNEFNRNYALRWAETNSEEASLDPGGTTP